MRCKLADGKWFDRVKATAWQEATWWDGHNQVSLATNSQWEHEELLRTPGGVWVKYSWSQWQGSRDAYAIVSDEEAQQWLIAQDHLDAVEELFGADAVAAGEV